MTSLNASLLSTYQADERGNGSDDTVYAAELAGLYEQYEDRVRAYIRARTPNVDVGDDLTQQVFLRALSGLRRFRGGEEQYAPWIFRIARNAVADYYRTRRVSASWESLPVGLHPHTDDLESLVVRAEDLRRLREALLMLDDDRRDLLALRFSARLTAGEIAAVIGKSEAATRKRLLRTLYVVKELYDGMR